MVNPFVDADIAPFLAMAKGEDWICNREELAFLLQNFPQGCLVYREQGRSPGYITSIKYGGSGWIGNLLVHPDARRRGIGRTLMEHGIDALLKSGVETVWLTASAKGAGLYRKLGFLQIDSVDRWIGKGGITPQAPKPVQLDFDSVREVDRAGWGAPRDALLHAACGWGRLYSGSGGFLCCQAQEDGTQIGPWGCSSGSQAGELLDQALAGSDGPVFLDVPAGNLEAALLLVKRGFEIKGSSTLMYLGAKPRYQPEKIFALASMGSMG